MYCRFCQKARAWTAFVEPEAFRLLSGADETVNYHRHAAAPPKHSCRICGVHTHSTGDADYMGGPFVAVFVSALDDATDVELAAAPVHYSDGRNNWQNPPAETRHL